MLLKLDKRDEMSTSSFLIALAGLHYFAVVSIVFEAIKHYNLDKYTPWAVLSLFVWFPVIIFY